MELELRTTQRLRRNEQIARTNQNKADDEGVSAQPKSAPAQGSTDKVSLSRQALAWLDQRAALEQEQTMRRQDRQSNILSALDTQKAALDDLEQDLDVLNKCQKIAVSIMKGNRVPPEDLKYLMENDMAGYKLAMAMRQENPDPKDEKSVLDDEDKNGGSVEESDGGEEAPSVSASAPAAASGGGEASTSAE